MFYLITFLISLAFSLVCNYFDVRESMNGIRAGVAVEGNGMATWIFSLAHRFIGADKIAAYDLWFANAIPKSIICFLAWLIFKYQASTTGVALIGGPTAALIYIGIDHLSGVRQWSSLLKKAGK